MASDVKTTNTQVLENKAKTSTSQLAFGATESEKSQYMSKIRSNRFSVTSALSEYDAAKKRSELYGGSGSTANALKNAEERLRDMGLTEQDVSEWSGANPRNKASVASKLEMKRTAMRSNEAFTPENMRYEKGTWVTDEPAKVQAAKPASQFRGFVSETHRNQMSGPQQSLKVMFRGPEVQGGSDYDGATDQEPTKEDNPFFYEMKQAISSGSGVTRAGDPGSYLLTKEALQALRSSGAIDSKIFTDDWLSGTEKYGARMRITNQGRGFSAEFSPVTASEVVEGSQQSMVDSAYGQYAKRMAMEAGLHNKALAGDSTALNAGKEFATKRLNQLLGKSGFSFDASSNSLTYSRESDMKSSPSKATADSYSKELETMRQALNDLLSSST